MAQTTETDFNYECSNGHSIWAIQPVSECPIYRKGHRCYGVLTRVGRGSRQANTTMKGSAER